MWPSSVTSVTNGSNVTQKANFVVSSGYGDRLNDIENTNAGYYSITDTANSSTYSCKVLVELKPVQPTATPTFTPTATPTYTFTRTATSTPTATPTYTFTPTPTPTVTYPVWDSSTGAGSVGTWNVMAWPFTTSANPNLVLIVQYGGFVGTPAIVSSIVWDGKSFTKAAAVHNGSTDYDQEVWYLAAPPHSTSSNITLTAGGAFTAGNQYAIASEYSNVDQFSPIGATSTFSWSAGITAIAGNLTTLFSGSALLDTFMWPSSVTSVTNGSNVTQKANFVVSSGYGDRLNDIENTNAGYYSITDTANSSTYSCKVLVELKPVQPTPTPTSTRGGFARRAPVVIAQMTETLPRTATPSFSPTITPSPTVSPTQPVTEIGGIKRSALEIAAGLIQLKTGSSTDILEPVIGVIVAPNPAASKATVFAKLAASARVSIRVVDLDGSIVFRDDLGDQPAGVLREQFSVSSLADGIYFVLVTTSDGEGDHLIGTFKMAVIH